MKSVELSSMIQNTKSSHTDSEVVELSSKHTKQLQFINYQNSSNYILKECMYMPNSLLIYFVILKKIGSERLMDNKTCYGTREDLCSRMFENKEWI